ncbi:MAG: hypothetical protein OMM_07990 [Candidatus Magnetoglobus multicellularis str. Araruama]|uniref:Uncharacterized protein n=1 Tax=Candidatus Magnetoglobus multicellularis str. Araruama TaxID=890399 RepID=A0A1V1P9Q9_9BACT|nr:MAG: hypothetical protein OMM_07990 [Candidatus Magnetoglobus multicellularis str. Araruama]
MQSKLVLTGQETVFDINVNDLSDGYLILSPTIVQSVCVLKTIPFTIKSLAKCKDLKKLVLPDALPPKIGEIGRRRVLYYLIFEIRSPC